MRESARLANVRARLFAAVLLLGATAIAPWTSAVATSCGPGTGDAEIVGRLMRIDGATATFRVDTSSRGRYLSPGAPVPRTGTDLAVFFYGGDEQFLRVGQRYVVHVWWDQGRFTSDVKTAQDPCAGGTYHADGSRIETSLISRPHVKQVLFAVAIVPPATLLLLAIWVRRRHNRRGRVESAAG